MSECFTSVGNSLAHPDAFQHAPLTLRARGREQTTHACFMSGSSPILCMINALRYIHPRYNTPEMNPAAAGFSSSLLLLVKITEVLPIAKFYTHTRHELK